MSADNESVDEEDEDPGANITSYPNGRPVAVDQSNMYSYLELFGMLACHSG